MGDTFEGQEYAPLYPSHFLEQVCLFKYNYTSSYIYKEIIKPSETYPF